LIKNEQTKNGKSTDIILQFTEKVKRKNTAQQQGASPAADPFLS
jgi:hypothetical protein